MLAPIGFACGSMAIGYPAATVQYYGPANLGRVYGRLFSAWGVAGLTAPLIAGYLFDLTRTYTLALAVAAGAAVLGLVALWPIPPPPEAQAR